MYTDMYETNFNHVICGFHKSFRKFPHVIQVSFGDSIKLSLKLPSLKTSGLLYLKFCDYQFEEVYSIEDIPSEEIEDGVLVIKLSAELSETFFQRGIYYCKLIYKYIEDEQEIVTTFINFQDLQLCVI